MKIIKIENFNMILRISNANVRNILLDIYKEIISNYRKITDNLDMYKIEDYLSLYKNDEKISDILMREVF